MVIQMKKNLVIGTEIVKERISSRDGEVGTRDQNLVPTDPGFFEVVGEQERGICLMSMWSEKCHIVVFVFPEEIHIQKCKNVSHNSATSERSSIQCPVKGDDVHGDGEDEECSECFAAHPEENE